MKLDMDHINKARRERGLKPLKRGRPSIGERPGEGDLIEAYQRQGLSIRATAAVLGVSKDAVWRGLSEQGIKARGTSRPSRLAVYDPAELRRRIKADGLRATARAVDLDPKALTGYLGRHGGKK